MGGIYCSLNLLLKCPLHRLGHEQPESISNDFGGRQLLILMQVIDSRVNPRSETIRGVQRSLWAFRWAATNFLLILWPCFCLQHIPDSLCSSANSRLRLTAVSTPPRFPVLTAKEEVGRKEQNLWVIYISLSLLCFFLFPYITCRTPVSLPRAALPLRLHHDQERHILLLRRRLRGGRRRTQL